jgi:23S rRNA maturation-related 3'-5' exoribonuclease YhaM
MSFACVLGMHEVGWEADRYTAVEKNAKLAKTTKETSNVTTNGYDINVNGDVASYLFERQGVATSFTKSVTMDENTFASKHWAVNDKTETVSSHIFTTKKSVLNNMVDRITIF